VSAPRPVSLCLTAGPARLQGRKSRQQAIRECAPLVRIPTLYRLDTDMYNVKFLVGCCVVIVLFLGAADGGGSSTTEGTAKVKKRKGLCKANLRDRRIWINTQEEYVT